MEIDSNCGDAAKGQDEIEFIPGGIGAWSVISSTHINLLAGCASLVSLTLRDRVTSPALVTIARALPNLEKLRLFNGQHIDSLVELSAVINREGCFERLKSLRLEGLDTSLLQYMNMNNFFKDNPKLSQNLTCLGIECMEYMSNLDEDSLAQVFLSCVNLVELRMHVHENVKPKLTRMHQLK